MHDSEYYDDIRRERRASDGDMWRRRARGAWRYLVSRSAETWVFFVAGVVIARILF